MHIYVIWLRFQFTNLITWSGFSIHYRGHRRIHFSFINSTSLRRKGMNW